MQRHEREGADSPEGVAIPQQAERNAISDSTESVPPRHGATCTTNPSEHIALFCHASRRLQILHISASMVHPSCDLLCCMDIWIPFCSTDEPPRPAWRPPLPPLKLLHLV